MKRNRTILVPTEARAESERCRKLPGRLPLAQMEGWRVMLERIHPMTKMMSMTKRKIDFLRTRLGLRS